MLSILVVTWCIIYVGVVFYRARKKGILPIIERNLGYGIVVYSSAGNLMMVERLKTYSLNI